MLIETPAQTYVTRESSNSIGSNDKNEKAYERSANNGRSDRRSDRR